MARPRHLGDAISSELPEGCNPSFWRGREATILRRVFHKGIHVLFSMDFLLLACDLVYDFYCAFAATTPFLELYVTLERTQAELNKYILEEPVEGMPLVAAVLFQEGDEEVATASGTTITLRLSYLLPKVLYEFAGQVAVYGDVDKKLCACMERMKEFIEAIDIEEVERIRLENEAEIRANFAAQRERKSAALKRREERIAKWAAEAEAASGDSSSGTLGLEESDREEDQQLKSDGDGAEEESDSKEITRLTMPSDGTAMSNPAARKRRRKISGKAPEDPVE